MTAEERDMSTIYPPGPEWVDPTEPTPELKALSQRGEWEKWQAWRRASEDTAAALVEAMRSREMSDYEAVVMIGAQLRRSYQSGVEAAQDSA